MAFVDGELCPRGLTFVWIKQDWALITVFDFAIYFFHGCFVPFLFEQVPKQIFCPQENLAAGQGKQIQ